MSILNIEAFRNTPLQRDPFDFICVPGFVKREALQNLHRDYPDVDQAGSVPVGIYRHGPAFEQMLEELRGPEIEKAFEEKFNIDLSGLPRMFTVRGMCRPTDGKIHPDSASKVITVLIYMNPPWEASGGRLRILRTPNLNDYVAEVPPDEGTLLAFRRSDTSWHGHEAFDGRRRAIQMNWVKGNIYIWHEQWRHRVGAFAKRLIG